MSILFSPSLFHPLQVSLSLSSLSLIRKSVYLHISSMFSSFRRQSTTVIKVVSRNQTATSPVMIDVQRLEQLQAEQKKKRTVSHPYPPPPPLFRLLHFIFHITFVIEQGIGFSEQYSTDIPQGNYSPF